MQLLSGSSLVTSFYINSSYVFFYKDDNKDERFIQKLF